MTTVPAGLPESCKVAITAQTPLSSQTMALMPVVVGGAVQPIVVEISVSLRLMSEMDGGVLSSMGVGVGAWMTVTVAVSWSSPPPEVAWSVYVVGVAGST